MEMTKNEIWRRIWSHNITQEEAKSLGCVITSNTIGELVSIHDNEGDIYKEDKPFLGIVYTLYDSRLDEHEAMYYCIKTKTSGVARNLSDAALALFRSHIEYEHEPWED